MGYVMENERFIRIERLFSVGHRASKGAVDVYQLDELPWIAGEGEGVCLRFERIVDHLPLRGKPGWMTPRAGVKTTLASATRLPGLRSQAGALFF
jgi:hypothetical protein